MKANDLITVVVPVYNVEKYLGKCLNSLINQTYKNIEIILIDDGSTDNSGKICDQYKKKDSRIRVIHKQNGGLSDARNQGIEVAKGKYITFVDSDDYVELDYIEYLYNLIKKHNVNISFCKYIVHYEKKKKNIKIDSKERRCTKIDALMEILYAKDFEVSACGKMYLLKHFENVRYPKGKLFEDNDTTYKLIDQNEFVALGFASKYHYIMRNDSITKKEFTEKQLYLIKATDNMCDDLSKYKELKNAITRKRCIARISTLNRMIQSTNRNHEMENSLRKDILKYKSILKDKKASNRDKMAILLLIPGLNLYRVCWSCYMRVTGRR